MMKLRIILSVYIAYFTHSEHASHIILSEMVDECEDYRCSQVYDPVCGMTVTAEGVSIIRIYQNLCTFMKVQCRMTVSALDELHHVPDSLCKIQKSERTRRDNSIVGAYQPCNHTCPTYCSDIYEPQCVKIYRPGMMKGIVVKPMINHCHVDLLSCALSLNVTVQAFYMCYKNPSLLMFMSQVAGLKSLHLLDDENEYGLQTQQGAIKQ